MRGISSTLDREGVPGLESLSGDYQLGLQMRVEVIQAMTVVAVSAETSEKGLNRLDAANWPLQTTCKAQPM